MGGVGNTREKSNHRAMVEQSHLPMAELEGSDYVLRTANAAFCRLLGKSAEEIIGNPLKDLLPLGLECLSLVDDVYRTGEARSHVKAREDQLDPVYWSYTCLPVKGESNEPVGVVVQVTETPLYNARNAEFNQALLISSIKQHELTENAERLNNELQHEINAHERAEVQLRRNRDTFFSLIEKAPFGLYVVDSQFCLQHVSSGAENVFSRIDPHIGRDFTEVLRLVWTEPFASRAIEHFRHTLLTGEPHVEKELTEQRVDTGQLESYDWRIERITLPDGQFGVVCYFYDISEQKTSKVKLQEADLRKSEFLATLAHELRNPLAPLRHGLELLALAQGEPATFDQAHGMMKRQLDQMVRLIDELLDLSRITRGTVELQLVRVDLRAILDQALESSRHLIDHQGHTLTVDPTSEPMIVEGDSMRLAQVFNNLVSNAAKYTDPGGAIRVHTAVEGNDVMVTVCDNGIGISPADQGRVFEMFAQVEHAHDRSQGGLGIGLSIVKHLVEQHGGHISISSGGLGKGSCFTVRLPLASTLFLGPPPSEQVHTVSPAGHRRILIVDDNEDAATMVAMLLGKLGHDIRVAYDGLQALAVGKDFRPDIILMDIGMPVLDGHEACAQMRRTPWGQDAFIIALTGWGQTEDKQRSAEAGFDRHLVKPVHKEALEDILAAHSDRKALH
jgi:signal transduction histidine kinase/CheY-like chemotaxis protein